MAWECKCECGNIVIVRGSAITSGNTKSCGCKTNEYISNANKTHGETHTKIYRVWSNMKNRCYNKKTKRYEDYGGRGISVCTEWVNSYESFRDWAFANGYKEDLTIDRIDNNGNYCPQNCKWVTRYEQNINKRNNIEIAIDGETKCLSEWCFKFGINRSTVNTRVRMCGWTYEKALTTKINKKHRRKSYERKMD